MRCLGAMKSTQTILSAFLAVALAACGASEPAPAQPTPVTPPAEATPTAAPDHGEAEHSHDFPGAVTAFHDVMAPKWHAEPGPQRQTDTCGAIAGFKDAAAKIGSDPVPEKAAAQEGSWHNAVADLNIAIGGLEAACAADGRAGFADAFHQLHEAFHRLVALIGHEKHDEGKHEHGEGEHEHGDGHKH